MTPQDVPDDPDGSDELRRGAVVPAARLRRSPRYAVFIGSGVAVGVVIAVVVSIVAPSSGSTGLFGYLLVVFGAFGATLGGLAAVLAAIVLDRRDARR